MDDELREILGAVFGLKPEEIHLSLTRSEISTWDSLRQMDLVVSLEERFGITLEVEEIVRMTSIAEIVLVLHSRGVGYES